MEKKTFLIVGGSSGIGLELTKKLSVRGHQVFVYSRKGENLIGMENVHFRSLDVTDDEIDMGDLPEVIDGLVYCPGTINLKPFRRLDENDFLSDFKINVTGAVKVIQKAYTALRKSDQASIVMFSTVAVKVGMNFHSSIAASKGAVEGLVRSLAAEFAPKIRVNAIAPSLTDTPLAAPLLSTEAKKNHSSEIHPLKRYGKTEDQVNAALFLLGGESSWITGQILHVDGGLSVIKS
ncbi:MAG: SDR family oxidoreductase [Bacteroidales bacterium]|nr:SDR family oxidoreductase [Bacteroidales bacterium]